MIFMTAAGLWSRAMRTGSPPASLMARSYCGMECSAYSQSSECGMGMAMRAGIRSAHPLDGGERLTLAMMTNFHRDRQYKNDGPGHYGHGHRKLAGGQGHIRMQATHSRQYDSADNSESQTHRETEKSPDKSYQQDANRHAEPAGSRRTGRARYTI